MFHIFGTKIIFFFQIILFKPYIQFLLHSSSLIFNSLYPLKAARRERSELNAVRQHLHKRQVTANEKGMTVLSSNL